MSPALPDIGAVVALMPGRYPALLVDRIESIVAGEAVGVKAVSASEPYFLGHFPGYPVMPGVLILEALTQLSGVLAVASGMATSEGAPAVAFEGVESCRFKRQVVPGDVLMLQSAWKPGEGRQGRFEVSARVDGQLAAEAVLLVTVDAGGR